MTKAGVLQIPQQTIRQNVVTFNLKLITKPIEGVWVNLRFKGIPKEIKMGVRGSEKENYQYQPLYNQILNSLTWSQTSSGGTTFWQREKKYKDIFAALLPGKELQDINPANPREFYYKENSGNPLPFSSLSSGEQEVVKVVFDVVRKDWISVLVYGEFTHYTIPIFNFI